MNIKVAILLCNYKHNLQEKTSYQKRFNEIVQIIWLK